MTKRLISPTGQILDLLIIEDKNINEIAKEKILTILVNTNYRWRIPITKNTYYYMVNFSIIFKDSFIIFSYFEDPELTHFPTIGLEEQRRANEYFEIGNRFLKKNNYEKAILNYSKCLEIDNIFLDAYYNRAYANKMLENHNASCDDWGILSELGQTEAIRIFTQFCNKNE